MTFQAHSKKSGDAFENYVHDILFKQPHISIIKNYRVPDTGCEVDFRIDRGTRIEYVECKGGDSGGTKRPGAERTDSVKKAIANAALIKAVYPEAYYVIYFSSKPKSGSSSETMIKVATEYKIVDQVFYPTYEV